MQDSLFVAEGNLVGDNRAVAQPGDTVAVETQQRLFAAVVSDNLFEGKG